MQNTESYKTIKIGSQEAEIALRVSKLLYKKILGRFYNKLEQTMIDKFYQNILSAISENLKQKNGNEFFQLMYISFIIVIKNELKIIFI